MPKAIDDLYSDAMDSAVTLYAMTRSEPGDKGEDAIRRKLARAIDAYLEERGNV